MTKIIYQNSEYATMQTGIEAANSTSEIKAALNGG